MAEEKESLFSKNNLKLLTGPLSSSNPITVQVLGICSALAVTAKVESAIVMALAVTIVVGVANMAISLLRNTILTESVSLFSCWLLQRWLFWLTRF